jgi:hypothetical protein
VPRLWPTWHPTFEAIYLRHLHRGSTPHPAKLNGRRALGSKAAPEHQDTVLTYKLPAGGHPSLRCATEHRKHGHQYAIVNNLTQTLLGYNIDPPTRSARRGNGKRKDLPTTYETFNETGIRRTSVPEQLGQQIEQQQNMPQSRQPSQTQHTQQQSQVGPQQGINTVGVIASLPSEKREAPGIYELSPGANQQQNLQSDAVEGLSNPRKRKSRLSQEQEIGSTRRTLRNRGSVLNYNLNSIATRAFAALSPSPEGTLYSSEDSRYEDNHPANRRKRRRYDDYSDNGNEVMPVPTVANIRDIPDLVQSQRQVRTTDWAQTLDIGKEQQVSNDETPLKTYIHPQKKQTSSDKSVTMPHTAEPPLQLQEHPQDIDIEAAVRDQLREWGMTEDL